MTKVKGFGFTGIAALAFLFDISGCCPRASKTKSFKIRGKSDGGQVHVATSARRAISGQRNLQDLSRGYL